MLDVWILHLDFEVLSQECIYGFNCNYYFYISESDMLKELVCSTQERLSSEVFKINWVAYMSGFIILL